MFHKLSFQGDTNSLKPNESCDFILFKGNLYRKKLRLSTLVEASFFPNKLTSERIKWIYLKLGSFGGATIKISFCVVDSLWDFPISFINYIIKPDH